MFLEYYGMREHPFGVTPDPRYLYLSATHREALASLFYGIEVGRGFMALVAKPGMGKTTLLFQLLERLRTSARTVFLFHTQCDSREFLHYLLSDMGVDAQGQDLPRMHDRLNQVLVAEAHAGRRFVLIIDEAQNLGDAVLETVRLLSDFETPSAKLMQIILAGQPQLAAKLRLPGLAQLRQRISLIARLEPFSLAETRAYVDHRLRVAGYKGPALFTSEAMEVIAARSGGIPRNINNLCFNALSLGFALERKGIDAAIIDDVVRDLDLTRLTEEAPLVPGTPAAVPLAAPPIQQDLRLVSPPDFRLGNKDTDSAIRREALPSPSPSTLIERAPAVPELLQPPPVVEQPIQRPDLLSVGQGGSKSPPTVDQPEHWEFAPVAQADAQPGLHQSARPRSAARHPRVGLAGTGSVNSWRRALRFGTLAAILATACVLVLFLEKVTTRAHHGQPQTAGTSDNTQRALAIPGNVKTDEPPGVDTRPGSGKEDNYHADDRDPSRLTVQEGSAPHQPAPATSSLQADQLGTGPAGEKPPAQASQSDQVGHRPLPSVPAAAPGHSPMPLPRPPIRINRGVGAQRVETEPARSVLAVKHGAMSLRARGDGTPHGAAAAGAERAAAAASSGLDAYRQAVQLSPGDPAAHHNLAHALVAEGDLDGAVVEYRHALHLASNRVESHLGLGEVLLKQRDFDGALAEFQVAAGLKPDDARAHYNAGLALYAKGDSGSLDDAVSEYREAIRLHPDDADGHYALGLALFRRGEVNAAIAEYRESLRLSPDRAVVREQLDRVLRQKAKPVTEVKGSEREPAATRADGTAEIEGDTQLKDSQREPAATRRVNEVSHLQAAKLTFGPKPEYPAFAKGAGIQGTVRLEVVIGKDGTVQQLRVLSGHPALAKAAEAAVKRWRYQPAVLNGTPIEVVTEVAVHFVS